MENSGLAVLQSKDHEDVLDTIDELRSLGISHYVDLPQVIVCGDQSSGKSSLLEAVSGIDFPRKDNLCTRFAIEVVLRRGSEHKISVSIVAGSERTDEEKQNLESFERSGIALDDIASVINEAGKSLGTDTMWKTFANDILRFDITGPKQPQLTLVDLPGLFQASNKLQSDADSKAVTTLVRSYMKKSRSIILAVVSAKNDFANQIVTKYARELDPHGSRTLGVITKPDTLHPGSDSEKAFVELAENQDVYFHHGWHVVKNRDFDTRFVSGQERDEAEEAFFRENIWTRLRQSQLGISSLRTRLSLLLRDQIIKELPSLLEDVEMDLFHCRNILSKLGSPRNSIEAQKLYLLRASQTFTTLVKSSIDGSYNDEFFGSITTTTNRRRRLRAVMQNILMDFSHKMRENGHARHIVETATKRQRRDNPRLVSRQAFIDEVVVMMRRSRGRELPGTYNPQIIGDLFQTQSRPWEEMVQGCLSEIWDTTSSVLDQMLTYAVDDTTARGIKEHIIVPALLEIRESITRQTSTILKPHNKDHPITYNHYLTENIQKLRQNQRREILTQKLDAFFGTNIAQGQTACTEKSFDVRALLNSLSQNSEADMDRYACAEAIDCMSAYYKVALKTLVDNFSTLVVEDTLLQRLPELFPPEKVISLDEKLTAGIAGEPKEFQEKRFQITTKVKALEGASALLKKFSTPSLKGAEFTSSIEEREESGMSSPESQDEDEALQTGSNTVPPVQEPQSTETVDDTAVDLEVLDDFEFDPLKQPMSSKEPVAFGAKLPLLGIQPPSKPRKKKNKGNADL